MKRKKTTKAWRVGLSMTLLLAALAGSLLTRIERRPFEETAHFQAWKQQLEEHPIHISEDSILVGWAKINLTPARPLPMAGYGNRWGKPFKRVRDSLYVRAITVVPYGTYNRKSDLQTLSFVSADLLIVPPNLSRRLFALLKAEGINESEVHLGTIHTHHSFGGWGQKLAGRLFGGAYDESVEIELAERMRDVIVTSRKDLLPAQVRYKATPYPAGIKNRLGVEDGTVDSMLRSVQFLRSDSSLGEILVYSAHSTTLRRDSLYLSRDYPGMFLDALEQAHRNEDQHPAHPYFPVFMSGAVGSMGFQAEGDSHEQRAAHLGQNLAQVHLQNEAEAAVASGNTLRYYSNWFNVPLPPQTFRVSQNWALRPWVFRTFFGESPGHIKASLLGNVLILGMPADFSGEIMNELSAYAREVGLHLIVTSFNGYYVGYITHDKNYDRDLYETRTMSWNGYQAGDYYTKVSKDLIRTLAREEF